MTNHIYINKCSECSPHLLVFFKFFRWFFIFFLALNKTISYYSFNK